MKNYFLFILLSISLFSCSKSEDTLFEELPAEQTGIDFVNRSLEKKEFNIFNYRNFYNGGGVAIGDVNNDGLSDLFVTSNFEDNKLYLNKGAMKFEDITVKAGIVGKKFWSTGVTFADVNGDGLMDIYVCNSGSRDQRGNQLYINQGIKGGIPTYKEQAKEAGLEDGGFSTHAAFFDYDRDGDLDMYLLNNSFTPIDKLGYTNLREERDKLGGDKLFRNDSKEGKELHFTDVSESAGIYGSLIGFGLGITIGDVNNDNWPDIYISNDFYERDYLYINQKNGTFKEDLENEMPHISLSSMGADMADLNDDGYMDIFVTDMLPGDDRRLKTTSVFEGYNLVELKKKRGFWHQYMRNNLQLNNGDGTFSEVGQLAGVHATDWSWGALIFDMDNDGKKDIFVANGIAKDLTDQDFVDFLGDRNTMQQMLDGKKFDYKEFTDKISSVPIPNYAYKNEGDLKFSNQVKAWGLEGPGFSNGSAYGDLDNDGDLDLVVNNVNAPLSVYKNKTNEKLKNHYLTVHLKGIDRNLNGIGARVTVYQKGGFKVLQQMPNRGFQSSSDHQMVFGLGANGAIDSLQVLWPNDKIETIKSVKADQIITLKQENAKEIFHFFEAKQTPIFADVTSGLLDYLHVESMFNDYDRDVLLKQKYSTQGPALAVGDVNGDGLEDVYVGGAKYQAGQLLLQKGAGFVASNQPVFKADSLYEDVDALFFDADGDKDLDLYVVTGGNEFYDQMPEQFDRLYTNDGKGNFTRALNALPPMYDNKSVVRPCDIDRDGDTDLFVGGRVVGYSYGASPRSYLLVNDGKGHFADKTIALAPELQEAGMLTEAIWSDIDHDGDADLTVVGDWMPIKTFENTKGKFKLIENGLEDKTGFWSGMTAADFDKDGDMDFIVGNLGTNTKLRKELAGQLRMQIKDIDKNDTKEHIVSYSRGKDWFPINGKDEMGKQIPSIINKKYTAYHMFAGKTVEEIFGDKELEGAVEKRVNTFESVYLENQGNKTFKMVPLPALAQVSKIMVLRTEDVDKDGNLDVIVGGNFNGASMYQARYDAFFGLILQGNGKGGFRPLIPTDTGLMLEGDIRDIKQVKTKAGILYLVARNNDKLQVFKKW